MSTPKKIRATSKNVDSGANVDKAVKIMRLTCMGLLGMLACLWLVLLVFGRVLDGPWSDEPFAPYIYFAVCVGFLIGNHFLAGYAFKIQRAKLPADANRKAKLDQYQREILARFASLVGGGIFIVIGYVLIHKFWILLLMPFLFAPMIMMLPTAQKFRSWCQLLTA